MSGSYYPVFLDLSGRRCVVVGGGEVAERKVEGLLDCSAQVTLISPDVTPGLQRMVDAARITWERRLYQPGDLNGAFLAIAATDDRAVNKAITSEAQEERVLLNVVDDAPLCTFIAPSVVRRGQVTLAISTGGASPALARKLRETLESSPLLQYADLADVLSEVRRQLKRSGAVVDAEGWQQSITEDLVELVNVGDHQGAVDLLMERLLGRSEASSGQVR